MTVLESYQYVQSRMNKLSSNSKDNIPKYAFVQAFNAVQLQWVEDRIKLKEASDIRINETQQLLKEVSIIPVKEDSYYKVKLPEDYFHYNRSTSLTPCEIANRLVKESNINTLLNNANWKPSLEWGETLATIVNGHLKIYVDNFSISQVNLVYYRYPVDINMSTGHNDINGNPTTDIDPEFKGSSLIEILNQTCLLLGADNMDQWIYQTMDQRTTKHN